ncbi:MAG: hypothetical protein ACOY8P_12110 [Thermodesulfobacteriota bacterium]|jgi:hypothetical protein
MADIEQNEGWRRRLKPSEVADPAGLVARLPRRIARGVVAYGVLVFLLTVFFVHGRQLSYRYLAWATPLGMLFGLTIVGFDHLALSLRTFLSSRCNRAICGFVLFFAYVLGYLVLFSLIVTYPVGRLIEQGTELESLAMEYGLHTTNVILFFAVLGWLDWGRFVASRVPPLSWRRRGGESESDGAKTLDN